MDVAPPQGIYGLPALGIVFFVLPMQCEMEMKDDAVCACWKKFRSKQRSGLSADWLGLQIAKFKLHTVEVSDARVLRMQVC